MANKINETIKILNSIKEHLENGIYYDEDEFMTYDYGYGQDDCHPDIYNELNLILDKLKDKKKEKVIK